MISVQFYSVKDKVIWDDFIQIYGSDFFFFKRDFIEYHSDRFQDASLVIKEDGNCIGILPASRHENKIICHGGLTYGFFILKDLRYKKIVEIFDKVTIFLKVAGFNRLVYKKPPIIFGKNSNDNDIFEIIRRGGRLLKRELTSIVDLRDYNYNKGRKSTIAKASRENIQIKSETTYIEDFYRILEAVLGDRHQTKPTHSFSEINKLMTMFPENIWVKVAQYEGEVVCGALLFVFGKVVHTQYLCSTEKARKIGALDFLLDQIITTTKSTKTHLSFGISTENSGLEVNEGLVFQKESFGAKNYVIDTLQLDL